MDTNLSVSSQPRAPTPHPQQNKVLSVKGVTRNNCTNQWPLPVKVAVRSGKVMNWIGAVQYLF